MDCISDNLARRFMSPEAFPVYAQTLQNELGNKIKDAYKETLICKRYIIRAIKRLEKQNSKFKMSIKLDDIREVKLTESDYKSIQAIFDKLPEEAVENPFEYSRSKKK